MAQPYLASPLQDRLAALVDSAAGIPGLAATDEGARVARGTLGGRPLVVIATDPSRASGAIGRSDAERICHAIEHAVEHRLPIVLLIDSAGAKLTEGVRVLGAFRVLQRQLLQARALGVPIVAVIGRNCFGGASLLAFTADTRIYPRGCRIGLSGPRAVAVPERGPESEHALQAVYGPESRARHDEEAVLVSDDAHAVSAVVKAWLGERTTARAPALSAMTTLTRRLRMYRGDPTTLSTLAPPQEIEARLDHLFTQGWSAVYGDGVVWGDGWVDGRETCFAGFVGGRAVGAFSCWRMIDILRAYRNEPASMPVTLLLDCPGQAGDQANEQILLSEFVTRVAGAAHALTLNGRTVELWLIGEAGGAIYVALAAAATTITAWPGIRLQTLPAHAVDRVVGTQQEQKPTLSALLEARVIDRWTRSPGFGEWPAPSLPG